jgi:uncharacterized pyridoxal phosphate-containing UPF0001 family protein
VSLVAVTKTFPAFDVVLLAELGVTDVAENKDQEASAKAAEVAAVLGTRAPRWHFVGQLQRNKARSVVRYADVVESVDRPELVDALAKAAAAHRDVPLDVLVQVDLRQFSAATVSGGFGAEAASGGVAGGRGGIAPAEVPRLADAIAGRPELRLAGVMAVAPLEAEAATAFAGLLSVAERLRQDHPGASVISAGMSGDLEAAVASGATHVRVGTALLGGRRPPGG